MAVSTIDALYNGGSEKISATSTGVDITGTATATTFQANAGGTFTTASGNDLNLVYPDGRSLFVKEGSTTHLTVDNSGNVGIGRSPSSGYKLDIEANNQRTRLLGTTGYVVSEIQNDGGSISIGKENSSGGAFMPTSGAYDSFILSQGAVNLLFGTNNTERMRITSSGDIVNTGSTLPSASVQGFGVQGQTISTSATSTSTRNHHLFYNGNGAVGSIATSGSSTSYNTSSDYRLKTDAQPMTGASARVQALNPVNFEWISDGTRVDGFLAHEAQAVVPEAVTGTKDAMRDEEYEVTPAVYEDVVIPAVLDEDGNELEAERTEQRLVTEAVMGTRSVPDMQGIDQSKLVPLLTAALQEALTKIDDMETRLAALEG